MSLVLLQAARACLTKRLDQLSAEPVLLPALHLAHIEHYEVVISGPHLRGPNRRTQVVAVASGTKFRFITR